jgi:superfamily II DNA/RNA helicase
MADSFDKMQTKFGLSDSFMDKIKKNGFKRPTPV